LNNGVIYVAAQRTLSAQITTVYVGLCGGFYSMPIALLHTSFPSLLSLHHDGYLLKLK